MPRSEQHKSECHAFRGASPVPAATDLLLILNSLLFFAARVIRSRK